MAVAMALSGKILLRQMKGRLLASASGYNWTSRTIPILPARSSFASGVPIPDSNRNRNRNATNHQEHEWKNPDGASDPNAYVRYLDGIYEGMSSSGPVGDYKCQVYDFLDIRAGDSIVDIGCGTGADVLALAEKLSSANDVANNCAVAATNVNSNGNIDGGRVVGVDISDTMVQEARKNLEASKSKFSSGSSSSSKRGAVDVSFWTGNAQALGDSLASDSFDICRCDRSLQHMPDPLAAIQEMVRITKPGVGRIVLSEPDWETLVVDSPLHQRVTRTILHHFTDTRVHGWMGRQLPRLLRTALGTIDGEVRVLPMTSPVTDLGFVREAYLDKARRIAVEASVVTEREASDWMDELVALDEAGQFFSTLTIYVARGNLR